MKKRESEQVADYELWLSAEVKKGINSAENGKLIKHSTVKSHWLKKQKSRFAFPD